LGNEIGELGQGGTAQTKGNLGLVGKGASKSVQKNIKGKITNKNADGRDEKESEKGSNCAVLVKFDNLETTGIGGNRKGNTTKNVEEQVHGVPEGGQVAKLPMAA